MRWFRNTQTAFVGFDLHHGTPCALHFSPSNWLQIVCCGLRPLLASSNLSGVVTGILHTSTHCLHMSRRPGLRGKMGCDGGLTDNLQKFLGAGIFKSGEFTPQRLQEFKLELAFLCPGPHTCTKKLNLSNNKSAM